MSVFEEAIVKQRRTFPRIKSVDVASAASRKRVFMNYIKSMNIKIKQGVGLKFSTGSEIDDQIVETLDKIVESWANFRKEILARKEQYNGED